MTVPIGSKRIGGVYYITLNYVFFDLEFITMEWFLKLLDLGIVFYKRYDIDYTYVVLKSSNLLQNFWTLQ